jgi:NAD(P)-dependent dehydrogenase (short-subunit alcohol dehydrogenase family)
MTPPIEQITRDGYDLQFGTNVVGHFYLIKLLLPTLISTAKASTDGHVRVLAVSSSSHMFASLNFNTFKDGSARKAISPEGLYAQSKFVGVNMVVFLLLCLDRSYTGKHRSCD